jgi:hypothetical protein
MRKWQGRQWLDFLSVLCSDLLPQPLIFREHGAMLMCYELLYSTVWTSSFQSIRELAVLAKWTLSKSRSPTLNSQFPLHWTLHHSSPAPVMSVLGTSPPISQFVIRPRHSPPCGLLRGLCWWWWPVAAPVSSGDPVLSSLTGPCHLLTSLCRKQGWLLCKGGSSTLSCAHCCPSTKAKAKVIGAKAVNTAITEVLRGCELQKRKALKKWWREFYYKV